MDELTPEALIECGDDFNAAFLQMQGVDPFCSAWPWALAARESFHQECTPTIRKLASGYLAMARADWPDWGNTLIPLEASWCLASPLAGPDPAELARDLEHFAVRDPEWNSMILAGIRLESTLWNQLVAKLGRRYFLFGGPSVTRRIASLSGGVDGFLSRRTSKFRNNLERARKKVAEAGLTFQSFGGIWDDATVAAHFETIMDIEARSWKGLSGQGVNEGGMRDFYHRLMVYMGLAGQCRLILAFRDGQPMGYIFGGILLGHYRGFQFSFDEQFSKLSLGNVLQLKMIELLCQEQAVCYDLGTDIEYKRHWSEQSLETHMMIVKR